MSAEPLQRVGLMRTALTVKQAAEIVNVNERTVYRMTQWGKLSAFKVVGT